jgi:phospholipid-binding lipoprotein MlaA
MLRRLLVPVLALPLMFAAVPARANPDPWESFNRTMFAFNNGLVDYVIEPLASTLETWTPPLVRELGSNFYANLTEPEFIVTNLFKGNHGDAAISAQRFLVNTTLGAAGLFDPATDFGLIRRETEFGESLCAAGVPVGPYLVLPAIGPTNAMSAGLITGFFTVEWYVLAMVSTLLATADLVVDLSASAASLRHAAEQPDMSNADPYVLQRAGYLRYLEKGCVSAAPAAPLMVEND